MRQQSYKLQMEFQQRHIFDLRTYTPSSGDAKTPHRIGKGWSEILNCVT